MAHAGSNADNYRFGMDSSVSVSQERHDMGHVGSVQRDPFQITKVQHVFVLMGTKFLN